jgi:hypothetical protein
MPTPNPKQVLVLFRLLFTGQEPTVSQLKPRLTPKERKPLEKAGLIEIRPPGRGGQVVLTEAGWDWASKNLDVPISDSARANETLIAVLAHLKAFLDARGIALGEMVRAGRSPTGATTAAREEPRSKTQPNGTTDLVALVRAVCLRAANGHTRIRVRLSEVRKELSDVPRTALDETLLAMQQSGDVVFFRLDDPRERLSADERDALNIAGKPHHVLYLNG